MQSTDQVEEIILVFLTGQNKDGEDMLLLINTIRANTEEWRKERGFGGFVSVIIIVSI